MIEIFYLDICVSEKTFLCILLGANGSAINSNNIPVFNYYS